VRKKLQPSEETFKWLFYSGSEANGDISAEPVSGQKIEERVVIDLDPRNYENRPGSTSSAVAEERQDE